MFTHGRTARRSITFIGFFTNLHLSGHLREVFVEKRHNRWTVQKFLKLQIGFEKVKLTRQAVWGAQRWTRTCRSPQPAQREGTPSAPRLGSPPWGPFWWGGHWAIFSWVSFQYISEVDDAWAWDSTRAGTVSHETLIYFCLGLPPHTHTHWLILEAHIVHGKRWNDVHVLSLVQRNVFVHGPGWSGMKV